LPPDLTPLCAQSLQESQRLEKRLLRLQKRITLFAVRLEFHQNLRLGVGGIFLLLLLIMAIKPGLRIELPVIVGFLVLFGTLVIRTRNYDRHLKKLKRYRLFLARQDRRCKGLPSGRSFESAQRAASHMNVIRDIGILGSHSLWTLLDETLTDNGQLRLLEWITRAPMNPDEILKRQELVQGLKREAWFFSRWGLSADSDEFRLSSSQVLKFLQKPFVEKGFLIYLIVSWLAWIAALGGMFLSVKLGWGAHGYFFSAFIAVSFLSLMKVGSPFLRGVGLSHHLSQITPIFEALENRCSVSPALERLAPVTKASGPSRQARKLNQVLAFMSVKANPLVHLIVNALSPWSITATHFLERRRKKIAYTFPQCVEELAELEALSSLVIFARFQSANYPKVEYQGRRPSLAFEGLFHPLIDRTKVVANSFSYPPQKTLGLLTGSNMSGKSTFLRTLGLNQILANMGAPVFAESFQTAPLSVETCIEVSDSLRDGFSYFYAEVRRLKQVLNATQGNKAVLYLIDEIFRGTNNRERHIGSRAVIRALAMAPHAVGFVSTHDLELTVLEKTLESVLNLHFREEFSNDGTMIFSYHLRHGPCPTTNALKIMAREGIAIEDPDVD